MIYEGSRYEFSDVERLVDTKGTARPTVFAAPTDELINFSSYTVRQGDRIDLLADRFLGDAELWWKIADANPEWMFWDYLADGLTLRIPSERTAG